MRLLIVNPNTSDGVTARIVTEAEAAEATRGVLAAIAAHSGVVEGIILAAFGDMGAAEVRASRPGLPVIGMGEAAFAEARHR
jgi:Asp/Glu/hydantoin racemase